MDKDSLVKTVVGVLAGAFFMGAGFLVRHFTGSTVDVKSAICGTPSQSAPLVPPVQVHQ